MHRPCVHLLAHFVRRDHLLYIRIRRHSDRIASADVVYSLSESSYSCLHRVIRDQGFEGFIRYLELLREYAHVLHRLRHEMPLCNGQFLYRCVSAELNDFHSVEKRFRDRICRVRGTYEEHIREIIRYVHVVIRERVVLFRVEYFKQSARRTPVV